MARMVGWLAGSVVLVLPCIVMAAPIVGNAKVVVRDVTGSLEHDLRILSVEADVFQDEEVATGANSATRLVFADGTNLTLGEKARLRLTRLVFDGEPSAGQVAINKAKGVFRWTSGKPALRGLSHR
jgi:hypothetical protein